MEKFRAEFESKIVKCWDNEGVIATYNDPNTLDIVKNAVMGMIENIWNKS